MYEALLILYPSGSDILSTMVIEYQEPLEYSLLFIIGGDWPFIRQLVLLGKNWKIVKEERGGDIYAKLIQYNFIWAYL